MMEVRTMHASLDAASSSPTASAPRLEQLPLELLSNLLSFLPGNVLAIVATCSKNLYHASQVESIWQTRCKTEFNISSLPDGCVLNYRAYFQLVLHKYGALLGVWQAKLGPFGGLVHVTTHHNGILALQYHPPMDPNVTKPLRPTELFSVQASEEVGTVITCHRGHQGKHRASLKTLSQDQFKLRCEHVECHRHPAGQQVEFSEWVKHETNGRMHSYLFQGQELLLTKFLIMVQNETCFSLTRLPLPQRCDNVLLQPGLFKGTYGGHGIELIMLKYNADCTQGLGIKVTGDPNVPASEISLRVDLERPMILTREQQNSINTLVEIDIPDIPQNVAHHQLPVQPFCVPSDCLDRYANSPEHCRARFHSEGQIAGHEFMSPRFTNSHFVVFDEDTFGHIWLELKSFSMYSRVKENFL